MAGSYTTNLGYEDLALESSPYPVVYTSGFQSVLLSFDLSVSLVPDELLDSLFDNLFTKDRRAKLMPRKRWQPPQRPRKKEGISSTPRTVGPSPAF